MWYYGAKITLKVVNLFTDPYSGRTILKNLYRKSNIEAFMTSGPDSSLCEPAGVRVLWSHPETKQKSSKGTRKWAKDAITMKYTQYGALASYHVLL